MTAASSADVREEDPPGEPWDELRDASGHARPAAHELLAAVERTATPSSAKSGSGIRPSSRNAVSTAQPIPCEC